MREKMSAMQHQFEEFVSTLNDQLSSRALAPERERMSALIPVVNLAAKPRKESK